MLRQVYVCKPGGVRPLNAVPLLTGEGSRTSTLIKSSVRCCQLAVFLELIFQTISELEKVILSIFA